MRSFHDWLSTAKAAFASKGNQPRFYGGEQVQFKSNLSGPLRAAAELIEKTIGPAPYTVLMPVVEEGEVLIDSEGGGRISVLEELLELVPVAAADKHPFHHIDENGRWAKNKCG